MRTRRKACSTAIRFSYSAGLPPQSGRGTSKAAFVSCRGTYHTTRHWSRPRSSRESTLKKAKVIAGLDANELFTEGDGDGLRGHTARGEILLGAMLPSGLTAPAQQLKVHTYHPYNTAQRSRRLDYVFVRGVHTEPGGVVVGSRHLARSDHDLVWGEIHVQPMAKPPRPTWGARRFKPGINITALVEAPLKQTEVHHAMKELALGTTVQKKYTSKFRESGALKEARRRAHAAAPAEARGAWKAVSRMRKQEMRQWRSKLADRASQIDWYAYRSFHHHNRRASPTTSARSSSRPATAHGQTLGGHTTGADPAVQANSMKAVHTR